MLLLIIYFRYLLFQLITIVQLTFIIIYNFPETIADARSRISHCLRIFTFDDDLSNDILLNIQIFKHRLRNTIE